MRARCVACRSSLRWAEGSLSKRGTRSCAAEPVRRASTGWTSVRPRTRALLPAVPCVLPRVIAARPRGVCGRFGWCTTGCTSGLMQGPSGVHQRGVAARCARASAAVYRKGGSDGSVGSDERTRRTRALLPAVPCVLPRVVRAESARRVRAVPVVHSRVHQRVPARSARASAAGYRNGGSRGERRVGTEGKIKALVPIGV
jgi:hypothetical protein